MKSKVFKFTSTIFCSSIILAFSNGTLAAEWTWVDDEIMNSNFGRAAGWEIGEVLYEGGEEYILVDEEGNEAVCRDYTITVDKYRQANPQGRGKIQDITEVEIETFCQSLEEEEV